MAAITNNKIYTETKCIVPNFVVIFVQHLDISIKYLQCKRYIESLFPLEY